MTTQSPTLASQATAELPKPPPLPEPYRTLDSYTRPVFSATQMDNRWLRGYEAGRASRAQSEWISVEDRLPEDGVLVVTNSESGFQFDMMDEGCWRQHTDDVEEVGMIGGRTSDVKAPTHWTPLPATPGETK